MVEPIKKSFFLLFLRKVQIELAYDKSIASQITFERRNIRVAFFPDVFPLQLFRYLLRRQYLRMHARNQHFFVIRSVEDSNPTSLRQAHRTSPHVIVIEFLRRRLLERINLASLRCACRSEVGLESS